MTRTRQTALGITAFYTVMVGTWIFTLDPSLQSLVFLVISSALLTFLIERSITSFVRLETGSGLLREHTDRWKTIIDIIPTGIFISDVQGKIIHHNGKADEIWGGAKNVVLKDYSLYKGWWNASTKGLSGGDWGLARALRGEISSGEVINIETFDGKRKSILNSASPIYELGKIVGAVVAVQDVTELIMAGENLRESESKSRSLTDVIPQLIWTSDSVGKIDFMNHRWLIYTGQDLEESLGHGWYDVIHPDDRSKTREAWEEANASDNLYQVEHRLRRRDGVYEWHLTRAIAMKPDGASGKKWFGTTTNIDEQKKTERKLEQAIQTREEVLGVLSHDLRNPLGAVLMNASLLERKAALSKTEESAFSARLAGKIRAAGDRMNNLIEDLLSLAKIEAGHFTVRPQAERVSTLMHEAAESIRSAAAQKSIQLEVELPKEDVLVSGDHSQVLRVFANLLGNAVKFTPEEGQITLSAEVNGEEVVFKVRDTGQGIAEHHMPNIFDRYWQASATAHKGTGLGLSISRGIVEAHGGHIWARSLFGSGSTFYFTLPLAESKSESSPMKQADSLSDSEAA